MAIISVNIEWVLAKSVVMVSLTNRFDTPKIVVKVIAHTLTLDTDIHIPFYIRGPGIAPGNIIDIVTTHTDVSSTILRIAGVTKVLDGTAIPLSHQDVDNTFVRAEHASIEYWGFVR